MDRPNGRLSVTAIFANAGTVCYLYLKMQVGLLEQGRVGGLGAASEERFALMSAPQMLTRMNPGTSRPIPVIAAVSRFTAGRVHR